MNRLHVTNSITVRHAIVVAMIGVSLFAGSYCSASASIHDCDSFQAWFRKQPASVLTLVPGDMKFPRPESKTSLVIDVEGATWYKGHVGGGGCLSGWYDPVHHLAAIRDQYDTY